MAAAVKELFDFKSKWKHMFIIQADRSKMVIPDQYDATELIWNLFTFSGTTIQFIFWKPVTWISIGLHYFGFLYLQKYRLYCEEHPTEHCWADDFTASYSVQLTDIGVFTTLVVYLFVSYSNMCSRSVR